MREEEIQVIKHYRREEVRNKQEKERSIGERENERKSKQKKERSISEREWEK